MSVDSWQQNIEPLVWSAAGTLLLLVLIGFFLYVLTQRASVAHFFRNADQWLLQHAPRRWRSLRRWVTERARLAVLGGILLFVGAVYVFAKIADGWMEQEALYRIDQSMHTAIAGNVSDTVLQIMHAATYLGDAVALVVVAGSAGVFLWQRDAYRLLAAMALTLGGGEVMVYVLKWVFSRPRPQGGLTQPLGASFPSGHTFTATVLYGFLAVLAWRFIPRKSLSIVASVVLIFLILLVGVSRVIMSVHWVSDVFGGWSIGLAWLTFALFTTQMWGRRLSASR